MVKTKYGKPFLCNNFILKKPADRKFEWKFSFKPGVKSATTHAMQKLFLLLTLFLDEHYSWLQLNSRIIIEFRVNFKQLEVPTCEMYKRIFYK